MLSARTVTRRLKITLPDPAVAQLEDIAATTGDRLARVAALMVRSGLAAATASSTSSAAPARPARLAQHTGSERALWLEPYGGDAKWLAAMWGAIVALHGRYPEALAGLNEGWWSSDAHVETLCALVVWRQSLDDAGVDPREELAFQAWIADYGRVLREEGGGVTRAWKPGAPPDDWAS